MNRQRSRGISLLSVLVFSNALFRLACLLSNSVVIINPVTHYKFSSPATQCPPYFFGCVMLKGTSPTTNCRLAYITLRLLLMVQMQTEKKPWRCVVFRELLVESSSSKSPEKTPINLAEDKIKTIYLMFNLTSLFSLIFVNIFLFWIWC